MISHAAQHSDLTDVLTIGQKQRTLSHVLEIAYQIKIAYQTESPQSSPSCT